MGRRDIGMYLGLVAALAACDADTAPRVDGGDETVRDLEQNGFRLNGFRLNGFRLNGFRLNGDRLDGVGDDEWIDLKKIVLGGHPAVEESWLFGSELHVKTADGTILSGTELNGATLEFGVSDESTVAEQWTSKLHIKAISRLAPDSDVWLYDVDIQDGDDGWEPLCTDHDGDPTQAILLGDVWDPDTGDRVSPRPSGAATFACRDDALAKCVEWGFAPWRSEAGVPLADHHQACTRAIRADFCGDGNPHTVNGTVVHFLDDLGILDGEPAWSYLVEAEWTPDGAVCLDQGNTRIPVASLGCDIPPKCGDSFATGGLIQTGKPSVPQ